MAFETLDQTENEPHDVMIGRINRLTLDLAAMFSVPDKREYLDPTANESWSVTVGKLNRMFFAFYTGIDNPGSFCVLDGTGNSGPQHAYSSISKMAVELYAVTPTDPSPEFFFVTADMDVFDPTNQAQILSNLGTYSLLAGTLADQATVDSTIATTKSGFLALDDSTILVYFPLLYGLIGITDYTAALAYIPTITHEAAATALAVTSLYNSSLDAYHFINPPAVTHFSDPLSMLDTDVGTTVLNDWRWGGRVLGLTPTQTNDLYRTIADPISNMQTGDLIAALPSAYAAAGFANYDAAVTAATDAGQDTLVQTLSSLTIYKLTLDRG